MNTLKTLLARLLGPRGKTRPRPGRAARARLRLEMLEERLAPSVYHVNGLLDTGAGSGSSGDLRYCVTQANANPGQDSIVFDVTGTITLASALPALTDAVAITGPGAARLTVSGNHANRVFAVSAGVTASISGVTIADGNSNGGGGIGIANGGALTVSGCTLSGNSSSAPGGGIYNGGTLALSHSTLSGNSAQGGGGGVDNAGTLTVSDCALSGNSASATLFAGEGGGIDNRGTLTVSHSTLSGNSATGVGHGGASIGGGIVNFGTLTAGDTTLSGNSAASGGGMWTDSANSSETVTLTNVTVANNRAGTGGSGSGGGLFINPTIRVTLPVLHNTLIAGNFTGATGTSRDDVHGPLAGAGDYNLIGDGAGMTGLSNGANHNKVGSHASPINPRLGPLANHGGPTQTIPLLAGSPAIDAGGNAYATAYDQRGPGYPRVVNGTIDIGAFEVQLPGTYHVTNLLDAGTGAGLSGDLRYCVTQANAHPGSDTIVIDVTGTIALGSALPALSDGVTISGPGAEGLTVSGAYAARVFLVNAGVTAIISGLTVTAGWVPDDSTADGGGVNNGGNLTLVDCAVTGNYAGRSGGGISNTGQMTLNGCTLSGNYAPAEGGGIDNRGTLALSGGALSGNYTSGGGGGLENFRGTATVSGTTLSGNYAAGNGGGLDNGGTLALSTCTVSGNSAAGDGGGIASGGTLRVSTSTVCGNSAGGNGGGLLAGAGAATLSNSTVYGNYSGLQGGGAYATSGSAADTLTLTNVTLAANYAGVSGGGLCVAAGAVAAPLLHNTLVAYDGGGPNGTPDDVLGAVSSGSDYNLIYDGSGMTGISNGAQGNQVGSAASPIDPLLGPLQDNGGPTQTCALLLGSTARGGGSTAYATATDQRGRPRVVGGRIDIGAYQTQDYSV